MKLLELGIYHRCGYCGTLELTYAYLLLQVFSKEDRVRLARKDLYKNSLRKAGHAWKTILEKGLSGINSCSCICSYLFDAIRIGV